MLDPLRVCVALSDCSHVVATVCLTTAVRSAQLPPSQTIGSIALRMTVVGRMPMKQDSPSVLQRAASQSPVVCKVLFCQQYR